MRCWRIFHLYLNSMNKVLAISPLTQNAQNLTDHKFLLATHTDPSLISDGSAGRVITCAQCQQMNLFISPAVVISPPKSKVLPQTATDYLHALPRRWVGWWLPLSFRFSSLCFALQDPQLLFPSSKGPPRNLLRAFSPHCQETGILPCPPSLWAHGMQKWKADGDIWQRSAHLAAAQISIGSRLDKVYLKQELISFKQINSCFPWFKKKNEERGNSSVLPRFKWN